MAGDDRNASLGVARRRPIQEMATIGLYVFLLSNVLWLAWGWHDRAWAIVILQFGLAVLNIRGAAKND